MKAFSREKAALLMFCLLMAIGAVALAFYLFAGHSWNYAATSLDDSFGNMDGYAVVVFEGTVDPEEATGAEEDDEAEGQASEEVTATPDGLDDIDEGSAATQDEREGANAEEAAATNEAEESNKATAENATEDSSSSSAKSALTFPFAGAISTEKELVTAELVGKSYEEKGATVFVLDSSNIDRYAEGLIMQHGSYRIGVMSVSSPRSTTALERQVAYFKANKVDFVVALVSNGSYLTGVSGVDVVIATDGDGSLTLGQTVNGAFRVYAPEVGSVGAVLISPSNVVSAKVIDEL